MTCKYIPNARTHKNLKQFQAFLFLRCRCLLNGQQCKDTQHICLNIFMEVDCWHRRTPHECLQLSNSAHLLESSHFIIPYNISQKPTEVALQVKLLFSRTIIFPSREFEATKFCLQKMLCTKSKTRWLFYGVLRKATFQLSRAGGLELYE